MLWKKKHIIVLNVQVRALTNRRSRVKAGAHKFPAPHFNIIIVVIPYIKICTSRHALNRKR